MSSKWAGLDVFQAILDENGRKPGNFGRFWVNSGVFQAIPGNFGYFSGDFWKTLVIFR